MPTIKFDEFLAEQRKNPAFENGFLKEDAKLENAIALLRARENAGLSQRELAERSGVPQSTIARIERGYNTSIDTLSKIAFALNKRVKIKFYIIIAPIILIMIGAIVFILHYIVILYQILWSKIYIRIT